MNKRGYLLLMGLLQALFITNVMAQELKTPTLEDLILVKHIVMQKTFMDYNGGAMNV